MKLNNKIKLLIAITAILIITQTVFTNDLNEPVNHGEEKSDPIDLIYSSDPVIETAILRPNDDDLTEWDGSPTPHWSRINEEIPDTTYVKWVDGDENQTEIFEMENIDTRNINITKIEVHIRGFRFWTGAPNVSLYLGDWTEEITVPITVAQVGVDRWISCSWSDLSGTYADLNNLQVWIEAGTWCSQDGYCRIDTLYCLVTYEILPNVLYSEDFEDGSDYWDLYGVDQRTMNLASIPSNDAYVKEIEPDSNFGSTPNILVQPTEWIYANSWKYIDMGGARSMYWDGTHYWVTGGVYHSEHVVQYDSNMVKTGISYFIGAQDSLPNGIEWDGVYWYILGTSHQRVYRYTHDWIYTGASYYIGNFDNQPWDIEWDGVNWWLLGGVSKTTYQFDANWAFTGLSYLLSNEDGGPSSISWDGKNWWMLGGSSKSIHQYDSNWLYTGVSYNINPVSPYMSYASDIEWDGTNWWVVDFSRSWLFKYSSKSQTTEAYLGSIVPYLTSNITDNSKLDIFIDTGDFPVNIDAYASNDFSEGTITWNNKPSIYQLLESKIIIGTGWTRFDLGITPYDNYNLKLNDPSNSKSINFFSSEYTIDISKRPNIRHSIAKNYQGGSHLYCQTNISETLTLRSPNNLNLELMNGSAIEIGFSTSSQNQIDLNLRYQGEELKSYVISEQGNTDFYNRSVVIYIDEDISIDQLELKGQFEPTTNLIVEKISIYRDKKPPETSITITGDLGNDNWYISDPLISFTADDRNGVSMTEYSFNNTDWFEFTVEFYMPSAGISDLYYRSTDIYGNVEEVKTTQIKIDYEEPYTEIGKKGILGLDGWYLSNVSVDFWPYDPHSGILKTEYSFDELSWEDYTDSILISDEGDTTIYFRSVDNAGNIEEEKQELIKIHRRPSDDPTFIYASSSWSIQFDPLDTWDQNSWEVIDQVVETLFVYNLSDPNLAPIPRLAADYGTWSSDGLNYTISLRPGVSFHDGMPFNASVVQWNINRLLSLANYSRYGLGNLHPAVTAELYHWPDGKPIFNKTEIIDVNTIRIVLNRPFGALEALLSFTGIGMLSPASTPFDDFLDITMDNLVGTGPFVFEEFQSDIGIRFHAFEDYWAEAANIKNLTFLLIPNLVERSEALLNGIVDFVKNPSADMLDLFESNPNTTLISAGQNLLMQYVSMNTKQINLTMRKAISYAIDYDVINDILYEGHSARLKSPIPLGMLFSDWSLDVAIFNLTKAREIMQSMGFGVGFDNDLQWTSVVDIGTPFATYNFTYHIGNKFLSDLYLVLKTNLRSIGILLTEATVDYVGYLNRIFEISGFNRDMLQLHYSGFIPDYNDPYNVFKYLFTNRSVAYNTAQYNGYTAAIEAGRDPLNLWDNVQLLMEAAALEIDSSIREQYYHRIQQLLVEEDMPLAYVSVRLNYDAISANYTNFQSNPMEKIWFYSVYRVGTPLTKISLKGTKGLNNWYISDVEVNFTVHTYGFDVSKTEFSYDNSNWHEFTTPFVFSDEGITTIYYRSISEEGMREPTKTEVIKLDKSLPVTTLNLGGLLGTNGWYISNVNITFSATDQYSGLKAIEYSYDSSTWVTYEDDELIEFKEEAQKTIFYRSIDNAGNIELERFEPVNIDKTEPITTILISGEHTSWLSSLWYESDSLISLVGNDEISGIAYTEYSYDNLNWISYTVPFEVPYEGVITIYYRSVDVANNIETTKEESFNIILSPFVIDDLGNGDYTWEEASEQNWCFGSGMIGDPYIIENTVIKGYEVLNCLTIENSDVFFNIRNILILSSSLVEETVAIKLFNVTNGKLESNNCSFTSFGGIHIEDSESVRILRNILKQNLEYGIFILNSFDVRVGWNLIQESNYGIKLSSSDNSLIYHNKLNSNSLGINIDNNNYLNMIVNNSLRLNSFGLFLGTDNQDNLFYNNSILDCSQYGVVVDTNTNVDNYFLRNNFTGNGYNARDEGVNNKWDDGGTGNYWDDYTGVDANGDGIGEIPYDIAGVARSTDYFPLWPKVGPDFYAFKEDIVFEELSGVTKISVPINYIGENTFESVLIRFFEEDEQGNIIQLGSDHVIYDFEPYSFELISIEWIPTPFRNIIVSIDPDDNVLETDENNNVAKTYGGGYLPVIGHFYNSYGVRWTQNNILTIGTFITGVTVTNTLRVKILDNDGDDDVVRVVFKINNVHEYVATKKPSGLWEVKINMGGLNFGINSLVIEASDGWGLKSDPLTVRIKTIGLPDWVPTWVKNELMSYLSWKGTTETYTLLFEIPGTIDLTTSKRVPGGVPGMGGARNFIDYWIKIRFVYHTNGQFDIRGTGGGTLIIFGVPFDLYVNIVLTLNSDLSFNSADLFFRLGFPNISLHGKIPLWVVDISFGINLGGEVTLRIILDSAAQGLRLYYLKIELALWGSGYLRARVDIFIAMANVYASLSTNLRAGLVYQNNQLRAYIQGNPGLYASYRFTWRILWWGSSFSGAVRWDFSVGSPEEVNETIDEGSWSYELDNTTMVDKRPRVATDGLGNAMMVWVNTRFDGNKTLSDICYSIWDGYDWIPSEFITYDDHYDFEPAITYDSNGNVMVVWSRIAYTEDMDNIANPNELLKEQELYYSVWNGTSWTNPEPITNNNRADGRVALSSDSLGNILAVWVSDHDGNLNTTDDVNLYYAVWNGTKWSPEAMVTDTTFADFSVALAYDQDDNAILCWVRDIDGDILTPDDRELHYARWDGTSWNPSSLVFDNSILNETIESPSLTIDQLGNTLITWVGGNENITRLYFAALDKKNTGIWSTPEIVHEDGFFMYHPAINIDEDNNAVIVWRGFEDDEEERLYYYAHNQTEVYFDGEICYKTKNLNDPNALWSDLKYLTSDNKTDWMASAVIIKGHSSDLLLVWESVGEDNVREIRTIVREIKADLSMASEDISISNAYAKIGEQIDITAGIRNLGHVRASNIRIDFFYGDPNNGGTFIDSRFISSLNYDEVGYVSIPWDVRAGVNKVYVFVDPLNSLKEINENNNLAFITIEPLPDLAISSENIRFSNNIPMQGELITIYADIYNYGGSDAKSIIVEFYCNSILIGTSNIPYLSFDTFSTVAIGWISLPGINNITVIIDPLNCIQEWYEDNNTASAFITLLPDLEAFSFTISDNEILYGDTILLTATFRNIGTTLSFGIKIEFYDGNPLVNGISLYSEQVVLGLGDSFILSFEWTASIGIHQVYATIDVDNLITESNEANNLLYEELAVRLLPDLTLQEPLFTYELETLVISIPVWNIGQTGTTGIVIELYDGDPNLGGQLIDFKTVLNILMGEFAIVDLTVYKPPIHENLYIIVDYANSIAELDESNNAVEIKYQGIIIIDAGLDQEAAEGEAVDFTGVVIFPVDISGFTFTWFFDDGTPESNTLSPSHAYKDDGIYTVVLTVTNSYEDSISDTLMVTVYNEAPTLSGMSATSVNEGNSSTLFGTIVDPSILDTFTLTVDWGDETDIETFSYSAGTTFFSETHPYIDDNVYIITLHIEDDDGGIGTDTLTATVNNVAPAIKFVDKRFVNENDIYSYTWEFEDPGVLDSHNYTIEWDDDTVDQGMISEGIYLFSVDHGYNLPGIYIVTMTLTDKDGGEDELSFEVEVLDITPPISTLSVQEPYYGEDPYYVSTTTKFNLSAIDAEMPFGSGVAKLQYRIDDGINITYTGNNMTFVVTEIGPHTIYYLSIDDAGNNETERSIEIVVNASELTYLGEFEGTYSDPVVLKANLTDIATGLPIPGKWINFTIEDQIISAITQSDGTAYASLVLDQCPINDYTVLAYFEGDEEYLASDSEECEFTISKEHAYAEYTGNMVVPLDAETITLRATVFDDDDGYWGDLTKIYVTITLLDSMTLIPLAGHTYEGLQVEVNSVEGVGRALIPILNNLSADSYLVNISFDPVENDYYWGDNSLPVVLIIYEPKGDFITGGGWIEDSNGNKANFGFNVKYKKNGLPKGQAIYVYREDDFVYIVKTNAWIGMAIISDMNYTIFEAKCNIKQLNATTGEIIWSKGNYKLVIEAWDHSKDGKEDIFQIRVYDKIGLIYHEAGFDPYGFLCGGNIVIHIDKKK